MDGRTGRRRRRKKKRDVLERWALRWVLHCFFLSLVLVLRLHPSWQSGVCKEEGRIPCPYPILSYPIISYHIQSYIPTYHTIPYHTIPYHTIPYHTIPYHTMPYHTIPYQSSTVCCVLSRRVIPCLFFAVESAGHYISHPILFPRLSLRSLSLSGRVPCTSSKRGGTAVASGVDDCILPSHHRETSV
jgi:hypothetical protein